MRTESEEEDHRSSADQNEASLHYKTRDTSVKLELSCPVAGEQILCVLYEPQSTAVSAGVCSSQIKKSFRAKLLVQFFFCRCENSSL